MSEFISLHMLVIPLLAAAVSLLLQRSLTLQKNVTIIFSGILLVMNIYFFSNSLNIMEVNIGGWPKPFAISFKTDSFSNLMLLATSLIYLSTAFYSQPGRTSEKSSLYFPLLNLLIFAVNGAFIANDLFNLYVWFEVMLLSSFVLMTLEGGKGRISGSVKYVILNIVSSLFFLTAIGYIYHLTRSLHFETLSEKLFHLNETSPEIVGFALVSLLIGFFIKSAIFPFQAWLPASYSVTSPALSGIFAGLLTKVGMYSIFRVTLDIFPINNYIFYTAMILAPLTMIVGGLGAISQNHIRKILCFHAISQTGFILLGLAFISHPNEELRFFGFSAALIYMLQHMLVKTNLFFISGLVKDRFGTEKLENLGDIKNQLPLVTLFFAICALSLAGVPPFSGFWAKLLIIKEILKGEHYFILGGLIFAGFLTVFSMAKIWIAAFWGKEQSGIKSPQDYNKHSIVGVAILLIGIMVLSFNPDFALRRVHQYSSKVFSGLDVSPGLSNVK